MERPITPFVFPEPREYQVGDVWQTEDNYRRYEIKEIYKEKRWTFTLMRYSSKRTGKRSDHLAPILWIAEGLLDASLADVTLMLKDAKRIR
jgi:hypothetical protein